MVLSCAPMYTLSHDALQIAYSNVCSVKSKTHEIHAGKMWNMVLSETGLQNTDNTSKYTTRWHDILHKYVVIECVTYSMSGVTDVCT